MNTLKIITYVGKAASLAVAFDWTPVAPQYSVLIFMIASIVKDTANRVGDYLDDKQMNNSFSSR